MKRVSVTNILAVLFALWLGAYCAGCASVPQEVPEYQVPVGAYLIEEPYEFYTEWLAEVVECAGAEGVSGEIEIWGVPGLTFHLYGSGMFAGYYDAHPDPDRIYLVDWDLENEGLVKHELLHAVADTAGRHPSPPYDYCAPSYITWELWRK